MVISETLQVPLTADARGVIRVGATRVPLQTLIFAFKQGDTAEEIAQKYPILNLTDIYAVIAYYLGHQEPVEQYLAEQQKEAHALRKLVETRCPPDGIRERLLARRA
ncbi:MAG: DUF433 domain-containing protein [Leptolinea sp.]